MIKAIIFDCYGVLYPDTFWTMAREYLEENFDVKKPQLHDLIKEVDLGRITRDELWSNFAAMTGTTAEEVYERLKEFGGLDKRLLSFIDGHQDKYKIGMISNVGHGFIDRMFVDKPATEYFDALILSSDVGLVKPDRRIYELAAEDLGVLPEECVFIDDLTKNVDGAINAGMQAIHYTHFTDFKSQIERLLLIPDMNN